MRGPGVLVDHATVNRWVLQYSPQLEAAFHRRKRPVWLQVAQGRDLRILLLKCRQQSFRLREGQPDLLNALTRLLQVDHIGEGSS